jgi:hypothetical protein
VRLMALLQGLIALLVPPVSGLLGVVIGAWLTARRERREETRRAYVEVLKILAEVHQAKHRLHLAASNAFAASEAEQLDRIVNEVMPRLHQAELVAMLTVSQDAWTALTTFHDEWDGAFDGQRTTADVARMRVGAVDRAQAALVKAAKRELRR